MILKSGFVRMLNDVLTVLSGINGSGVSDAATRTTDAVPFTGGGSTLKLKTTWVPAAIELVEHRVEEPLHVNPDGAVMRRAATVSNVTRTFIAESGPRFFSTACTKSSCPARTGKPEGKIGNQCRSAVCTWPLATDATKSRSVNGFFMAREPDCSSPKSTASSHSTAGAAAGLST